MTVSEQILTKFKAKLVSLSQSLGFQDLRVSDTNTSGYYEHYQAWLAKNHHAGLSFLERNQELRQYPEKLHENTLRVISLRYDYLPTNARFCHTLSQPQLANVSRYALGRDYHKLMRKKLSQLCEQISQEFQQEFGLEFSSRVFVDSAPILESAFAEKSGLGWKGKHTLVISPNAGSWFFLGEILISLPLPADDPIEDQCGNCVACINICPTQAILPGKKVDAGRCISYLTIENQDEIPVNLRASLGNRVYGCDDCQLICPWNRYANLSQDTDFHPRNQLDDQTLLSLWQWDEQTFLQSFEGSPIRRIGYQNWLRNLAVAIGNVGFEVEMISQLEKKYSQTNDMVKEHIDWAIAQIRSRTQPISLPANTQKLIKSARAMMPRDAD